MMSRMLALPLALMAAVALNANSAGQAPSAGVSSPADRCAALATFRLPDVRLTENRYVPADPAARGPVHVGHCRATGVIGTEIGFSVWLPDEWNGRFLMSGGGGYVGAIPGPGAAVDRGFAVTSTDTGHQADGVTARWAMRNLERQVNYAYLATHRTAESAKFIVAHYYAREPHHAYFVGCSTGGRQALMEAQRFPGDFDGIVSGAPVYDWTRVLSAGIKNAQAAFPDPASLGKPIVTADNLKLLQASVLKACDAADGVTDGVVDDPPACKFDLASVTACAGDAAGPECLTRAQRAAIQRVYSPLTDDKGVVYEGQPVGAEALPASWQAWITGNERAFAATGQPALGWAFSTEFFKYFVFADPAWDYSKYDVAKNWRARHADVYRAHQCRQPGSLGVPRAQRQAAALARVGGSRAESTGDDSLLQGRRRSRPARRGRCPPVPAAGRAALRRRTWAEPVRSVHADRGLGRERHRARHAPRDEARRRRSAGAVASAVPVPGEGRLQGLGQHRRGGQLHLPIAPLDIHVRR